MDRAIRDKHYCSCVIAADGTVTEAYGGLTDGASGVGSCTLTDTSLYTITLPSGTFDTPETGTVPIVKATPFLANDSAVVTLESVPTITTAATGCRRCVISAARN